LIIVVEELVGIRIRMAKEVNDEIKVLALNMVNNNGLLYTALRQHTYDFCFLSECNSFKMLRFISKAYDTFFNDNNMVGLLVNKKYKVPRHILLQNDYMLFVVVGDLTICSVHLPLHMSQGEILELIRCVPINKNGYIIAGDFNHDLSHDVFKEYKPQVRDFTTIKLSKIDNILSDVVNKVSIAVGKDHHLLTSCEVDPSTPWEDDPEEKENKDRLWKVYAMSGKSHLSDCSLKRTNVSLDIPSKSRCIKCDSRYRSNKKYYDSLFSDD